MNRNPLEEFANRLGQMLPEGAQEMRSDFERNAKSMMQSTLNRMDLVTREEFDAQRDVLARTREQVETLAARVSELERKAGITPPEDESPADPD
ncbi:MAG: accessory factor UbiK family protein [Halofilum sp. (in: g-proteobacteria)]|nr:accessory factor UbiK family protein [Halofilum sp. (in: g-proteobacteria)]